MMYKQANHIVKISFLLGFFSTVVSATEISPRNILQSVHHNTATTYSPFSAYNVDKNRNILSLDGGGIRGLISALMLLELETRITDIIGKPIRIGQVFDLVVGTSTGAITTLSLTVPDENDSSMPKYSAQDLVDLYEKKGAKIFERSFWRKLTSFFGLVDEKYDRTNLDELLKEYLSDHKICDAVTNVCVTSYEITDQGEGSRPVLFRSYKLEGESASSVTAVDAAEASGAAPTYFEPKKIIIDNEVHYYIDGGMTGQNDPDCRALLEMKALVAEEELSHPDQTRPEDYFVVSLGTGEKPALYNPQRFKNGGALNLVIPVIEIALDAPTQNNVEMMKQQAAAQQSNNYYRLNPKLTKDIKLDDTSPTALQIMRDATKNYIEEHTEEFDLIVKRLVFTTLHKNQTLNHSLYDTLFMDYQQEMVRSLRKRRERLEEDLSRTNLQCNKLTNLTPVAAEDFTEVQDKFRMAVERQPKVPANSSEELLEMRFEKI